MSWALELLWGQVLPELCRDEDPRLAPHELLVLVAVELGLGGVRVEDLATPVGDRDTDLEAFDRLFESP
jgi:hypothetical protein